MNLTVALVASRLLNGGASVVDLNIVMMSAALSADYVGVVLRQRSDQRADVAEQEERYAVLVGGSPDLIIRYDRQGHVLDQNRPDLVVAHRIADRWAGPEATAWEAPRPEQHDWTSGDGDSVRWYRTRIEP